VSELRKAATSAENFPGTKYRAAAAIQNATQSARTKLDRALFAIADDL
jgi:hypothetical protein